MTAHDGWLLVATTDELPEEITPLQVGGRRLIAVSEDGQIRVFDGSCPHRGAHLGYGGRRDGDCVVCPFHGRRIRLGGSNPAASVREHPVVQVGAAVFVRLGDDPRGDRGFEVYAKELADTRVVVAAARLEVAVPPEYVVENAFDIAHFAVVHRVPRVRGYDAVSEPDGALSVRAAFSTMMSPWIDQSIRTAARRLVSATGGQPSSDYVSEFYARAFSPGLVVTEFGPPGRTHVVITGATPRPDGGCTARVVVGTFEALIQELPSLAAGARKALAEDVPIWDHLDLAAAPHYDAGDASVLAFQRFCDGFGAAE